MACRNIISLTDVGVLGWLGKDELAAVAFAQIVLNLSGVVLWAGAGDALIALTAQAIGAKNPKMAGIWLQTSLFAITLFALPIGVFWWFTGDFLRLLGSAGPDERVANLAAKFARYSLIWLIPSALNSAFAQWLNGQRLVKPTIPLNVFFVAYNAAANIVLVHGIPGWFDGMGFIGSPLATASTKILRGIAIFVYIVYIRGLHKNCWHPWTWEALSRERLSRFFAQSIPSALIGVVEQAQFVVITLFVASLGTSELDAHTGMLNVFMFVTCGMYGLTDAGASTIGGHLGANRPEVAKKAAKALIYCMMSVGIVIAIFFAATQTVIGHVFSQDHDVIKWASKLGAFCGAAYFLLSVTFACFNASGTSSSSRGRTRCLPALWGLSVPTAYLFGFVWPTHHGFGSLEFGRVSLPGACK